MAPPTAFSHFSAIAELFVTIGVLYVVLTNYRGRAFAWKVAAGVIVFEFFVNMLYMTTRMRVQSSSPSDHSPLMLLAAIHGVLSLVIFALLVVLAFLAYNASKRGENFFQVRPGLTWSFIVLWFVSVGSGWTFYLAHFV